jgi:hypothetical protein
MHARNFPEAGELDRVKIRRYKKIFRKMIQDKQLSIDKGKYQLPKHNDMPSGLLM